MRRTWSSSPTDAFRPGLLGGQRSGTESAVCARLLLTKAVTKWLSTSRSARFDAKVSARSLRDWPDGSHVTRWSTTVFVTTTREEALEVADSLSLPMVVTRGSAHAHDLTTSPLATSRRRSRPSTPATTPVQSATLLRFGTVEVAPLWARSPGGRAASPEVSGHAGDAPPSASSWSPSLVRRERPGSARRLAAALPARFLLSGPRLRS